MTYTPPPPTGYQQPQQWPPPKPGQFRKHKAKWWHFALLAVVIAGLFGLQAINTASAPPRDASLAPIKASPADTDKGTYESLTDREYAVIAKNPDAHRGRKVVVFGEIYQADTRIGETTVMAYTAGEKQLLSYSQNAEIRGSAAQLREVVKGDQVEIWATVLGEMQYTDVSDRDWRVPSLQANMIEVIPN
ncbi:hypothetical protein GS451_24260 [Rhodococcus hoagii]|nr:hypothetical protein [Prescottella equi]NKV87775.1 hypothetical protein [Prescottella equi]